MKRRAFLKALMGLFSSAAVLSFLYPLLKFLAPPSGEARFGRIVILKSEVPAGKSKDIVVNNMPAFIINRPDKGLIALSKVCTHLGCLVEYDGEGRRIVCPCHAGIYDLEGNVLSGPPPKPLPRLLLRVEGENIVIG